MHRRRALVLFVNSVVALIGGGLSAVLGAFALRPAAPAAGPLDQCRRGRRPHAQRAGAARAVAVAPGRLVSRARPRNGLPRLGRRQDPSTRCRPPARTSVARSAGTPTTTRFRCPCHGGVLRCAGARSSTGRRRVRSTRRGAGRRPGPCWCGCEAAVRLAAVTDRVPRRAPRAARRDAAPRHRLVLHARQRPARAARRAAPDRGVPDALLRAHARTTPTTASASSSAPRRAASFAACTTTAPASWSWCVGAAHGARRRLRVLQAAARGDLALGPRAARR